MKVLNNNEINSKYILLKLKESNKFMTIEEGLKLTDSEISLIQVSIIKYKEFDNVALCILENLEKYIYHLKKKKNNLKKSNLEQKKIIFDGAKIQYNDFERKMKQINNFLLKYPQVKVSIKIKRFTKQDQLDNLCNKIIDRFINKYNLQLLLNNNIYYLLIMKSKNIQKEVQKIDKRENKNED